MMATRFPLLGATCLLLAVAAVPVRAADQQSGLRPEVGKPLQAARLLITQRKFSEALVQIKKAEAAAPLGAEEVSLLEQLRGVAAQGAGDTPTAIHAFETAIASPKLAPADRPRLMQSLASLYYQVKDYPKAITWAERYRDAGGKDEATGTLLVQAYYENHDWTAADRTLTARIAAIEQAHGTPTESQLRLLADIELNRNDPPAYQAALEKLVADYPKPEYWTAAIQHLQARAGFPRRLALDVSRLSLAVGTVSTAAQYTQTAELALEAGLPGEAKAVLDQGVAAHILGDGPEAARQERLRTLATRQAAEDVAALEQRTQAAGSAADGTALVEAGVDHLGHGQPEEAARLIEQGLAKGVTKHPDDAELHLGIAYLTAGRTDKALHAFRSIQEPDTAGLARLWAIHAVVRPS